MNSEQETWNATLAPVGTGEEDQDAVRARLRALPAALGYPTATAFAIAMGIGISRWNNAVMTGVLGKDLAFTLYAKIPGMRIEWLWFGDRAMMPAHLLRKLDAAAAGDPPMTSRKGTTQQS